MKLTNMMTLNTTAVATAAKEGADVIATTSASTTDESDASSSSASFENDDDDDCYFVMDGTATHTDDSYSYSSSSPSVIHYMGREFPADQFQHTAQVMEESRRSAASASASMGLQDHEQLSDRWSALSATVTDMLSSASQRGISSRSKQLQLQLHNSNSCHTRRSTSCIAAAPTASANSLLSRSEHVLSSSAASRRATTGSSRASFVQKVLEFGSQHSAAGNNNNNTYHHYNLDDKATHYLQKWGITSSDVMDIIQDEPTFAKLQQDLRKRRAITNSLVEQRMYIFVHNTKTRQKLQQKEQQQQQVEEEQVEEEKEEEAVEVEPPQEQPVISCDC